ncbi:DUF7224 domain-containing protein [Streptomyces xantholiticus]|uniref:DUF7224 domain-containing protein n=1 Tax=Streptomyces xantholiticus TaxID=68285 RepID=A0ABV1USK1_9ACTN
MRMLLTEMRRGEAKWVAGLMGAIGCYYFLSESPAQSDWIGWWTQTSLRVQLFAVIVMGSLMSSAAAWAAGRAHRHQVRIWADTTARSGWTQSLVLWLAAWLWSLIAYGVLTTVAFARTAQVSETGGPVWTPLLLGASMLALQTGVGVALGTALPSRVCAPFAGVLWYGLFVALPFVPTSPLNKLFPAIDEHWDTLFEPNTTRMLVAMAWCLALSLVLPALPALRRSATVRPRPLPLVALGLVALTAGGALVAFRTPVPDSYWAVRKAQPSQAACATSGRTTACLWPEDRHLLPRAEAAVRHVDTGLGTLSGLNRGYYATGLELPRGHTAELPLTSPDMSEEELTDAMFTASLPQPPPECEPHLLKETGGYPDTFLFEAVVRHRLGAPVEYYGDDFGAALERVTTAPRAEQDRWIEASAGHIRACRPVPALLPAPRARP